MMASMPPRVVMFLMVASSRYVMQSHRTFPLSVRRSMARWPMAICGSVKMLTILSNSGSFRKTFVYFPDCRSSERVVQDWLTMTSVPNRDLTSYSQLFRYAYPSGGTYCRGSSQISQEVLERVLNCTPHARQMARSISHGKREAERREAG